MTDRTVKSNSETGGRGEDDCLRNIVNTLITPRAHSRLFLSFLPNSETDDVRKVDQQ